MVFLPNSLIESNGLHAHMQETKGMPIDVQQLFNALQIFDYITFSQLVCSGIITRSYLWIALRRKQRLIGKCVDTSKATGDLR